jgi:hypothetical protein
VLHFKALAICRLYSGSGSRMRNELEGVWKEDVFN